MIDLDDSYEGPEPDEGTPADKKRDYADFLDKVQSREQELKDKWVKDGQAYWNIYSGLSREIPFNILFSNTEIIVPAVFSKKPIPKVLRRFDEARADVPAKAMQRMLSFCMDTGMPQYPDFMGAVEDSVLDAAIPGQGQIRVRLVSEIPILDYVPWHKFIWGYCERWEDCPWIAFRVDLSYADAVLKLKLDEEQAKELKTLMGSDADDSDADSTHEKKPPTIAVYETWVRSERKVLWLSAGSKSCCLAEDEDPLGLQNFYPIPPKPLFFVHSTTDTLPRPLYALYKEQAEELNEITRRLNKIIKAMKVRGIYAGQIPELANLFEQDETTLVPSETASQIMSMGGKGLDALIWMIPVDRLILVAKELYAAREQVKGVIYEILGIGDILRGVSKASETLGAQELKDKWGSLRVNRSREKTAEFIRAGLRLMAEVASKHTPPELWAKITGMELQPPMESAALQNPVPGQPAPPPPDPMQTWEGVLEVLQNDITRSYTIDVETNSTVDSEATTEKQETAEFMNAFGQAMSGLKDLMMTPEGFEAGKTILIGITSKFQLGEDVEPLLRKIKPPQQGLSPEMQKMQQDLQKKMEEVGKREQGAAQQEAALKDMMAGIKEAQAALKTQSDELALRREQQRRDEDAAKASIELEKREAIMEIREEALQAKAIKQDAIAQKAQVQAMQRGPATTPPRKA